MNIFVGNLNFQTTEKQLENIFSEFGQVRSARIVNDAYTKRPRGFGFVDMPDRANAEKAIETLHNTSLNGQSMIINEARSKNDDDAPGSKKASRY